MKINKKYIVSTSLFFSLILNGCSTGSSGTAQNNDLSVSEISEMIPAETEDDENFLTEQISEVQNDTSAGEETQKPEKTVEERSEIIKSTEFYGFDTEPYQVKGTGPAKPDNYLPAECVCYCEDAKITDPVLNEMILSFTEESRQSITADFERFAAFYNLNFDVEDIADFITEIQIINSCCIVIYRCEFDYDSKYESEFFQKTGSIRSASGDFGLRCGYFDISGHRRLELSDLFFKDYDFTAVINREVRKEMEYTGSCDLFRGLNREFMTLFSNYGVINTIENPFLTPYPYSVIYLNDHRELYSNSCIYSEPVMFDNDVYEGVTAIRDIRDYIYTVYGADERYPGMIRCPLKSILIDEETLEAVKKKASDDLGEYIYPDPLGEWTDPDQIYCGLCVEYLIDYNIFYAHIDHDMENCRLLRTRKYYDAETLEELSVNELFSRFLGENWHDYFECDTEDLKIDNVIYYDQFIDSQKLIRSFTVDYIKDDKYKYEFKEVTCILKDGKWLPEEI